MKLAFPHLFEDSSHVRAPTTQRRPMPHRARGPARRGAAKGRYFHSQLGRFIQRDPIGTAGGRNLYAFAGNDPVNFTDPRGESAVAIDQDGGGGGPGRLPEYVHNERPVHFVNFSDWLSELAARRYVYRMSFAGAGPSGGQDQTPDDPKPDHEGLARCLKKVHDGYNGAMDKLPGLLNERIEATFGTLAERYTEARFAVAEEAARAARATAISVWVSRGAGIGARRYWHRTAASYRALYGAARSWAAIRSAATQAARYQRIGNQVGIGAEAFVGLSAGWLLSDRTAGDLAVNSVTELGDTLANHSYDQWGIVSSLGEITLNYIRRSGLAEDQATAVIVDLYGQITQTAVRIEERFTEGIRACQELFGGGEGGG